MSFWTNLKDTAVDTWNGNGSMYGNAAASVTGILGAVPGLDKFVPDEAESKAAGTAMAGAMGADTDRKGEGNYGNKIGTVLGGVAGMIGGPGGAAVGAMLGSSAGGWIARQLGDNSDEKPDVAKHMPAPPTILQPEP